MSIKENVSFIKDEISTEEQFFESFFKLEKFYKKYKLLIIGGIVVVFGYFISTSVLGYINEQNTIKANEAYNKVILNPQDKQSLESLKNINKTLYDIALYKINHNDTTTNVEYLKEIGLFNKAVSSNNIAELDKLILDPNFLLKDFALFSKALILIDQKQYNKAKQTVNLIADNSAVSSLSIMLKHFLVTK